MGPPERSRERVQERLAGLEVAYGSFPINQTTLSLSASRFEKVRERIADRPAEIRVEVSNDEEQVLHLTGEGETVLPRVPVGYDENLERRVKGFLRDRLGLECAIDGLERATIAGIRNADDPAEDVFYHLVAVLSCTKVGGTSEGDVTWVGQAQALRH